MDQPDPQDAAQPEPPTDRRRAEVVHRLQIGLSGLAAMILLVGLANIIQDRARIEDSKTVPEAAVAADAGLPPPKPDPLADAGIVPDLPAEPATQGDRKPSGGANEPKTP
ncbi:MAG: hypothetical protein C0510_05720 [Erythrobacter sp.]|nr:hypothetical protein [Erythrobacter sp.]